MIIAWILILTGAFTLICTVLKPSFYWENEKHRRFRKLFGEGTITVLSMVLGIMFLVAGAGVIGSI